MSVNELVIWGASGHALVVADILRLQGQYRIIAFLDDTKEPHLDQRLNGVPILHTRERLITLRNRGVDYGIIAIGDCKTRMELAEVMKLAGYTLIQAIHPRAIVADDAVIGNGTVVAAGAVIGTMVRIGNNVIVNTSSSIDHECEISDGVHVGPGVHMGGKCIVECGAWLGIGATVADRVRIGENAVIGAGAVVLDDIPANVIAYGVPAKVIRSVVGRG